MKTLARSGRSGAEKTLRLWLAGKDFALFQWSLPDAIRQEWK